MRKNKVLPVLLAFIAGCSSSECHLNNYSNEVMRLQCKENHFELLINAAPPIKINYEELLRSFKKTSNYFNFFILPEKNTYSISCYYEKVMNVDGIANCTIDKSSKEIASFSINI